MTVEPAPAATARSTTDTARSVSSALDDSRPVGSRNLVPGRMLPVSSTSAASIFVPPRSTASATSPTYPVPAPTRANEM